MTTTEMGESTLDEPTACQKAYMRHVDMTLAAMPTQALMRGAPRDRAAWEARAAELRPYVARILGLPQLDLRDRTEPVTYTVRATLPGDGYVIDKIVYESESNPKSLVPAHLYRPTPEPASPAPGMVVACGHLGSKSGISYQYMCQLYARMGCYVLMPDPIGEEERHLSGELSRGGHREDHFLDRGVEAGRPVVGKMVWDLVRGIDLLRSLPGVDHGRIACAGNSLGGTVVQYLAAVDPRLSLCLCAGWTADYTRLYGNKGCCWRVYGMMQMANQAELVALAAPHCAYLVLGANRDWQCPQSGTVRVMQAAQAVYALYGAEDRVGLYTRHMGDHHPYQMSPAAIRWIVQHFKLDTPLVRRLLEAPTVTLAEVVERHARVPVRLSHLHALAETKEIEPRFYTPQELRVLTDEERRNGPFTLEAWYRELEPKLPSCPVAPGAFQRWTAEKARLRAKLQECLGPGLEGLAWGAQAEAVPSPFPNATAEKHSLGREHFQAYVLRPQAPSSGRFVIYQPASRSAERVGGEAESKRIGQWLERGDTVILLDALQLYDNAFLLGINETAVNVRMVRCAVDGALALGAREVWCRSEVDDVAAWAGALDERIDGVEIGSRSGTEMSVLQKGRHEGVVPGYRTLTDYLGLCALILPRRAHFDPGILPEHDASRWDAVLRLRNAG